MLILWHDCDATARAAVNVHTCDEMLTMRPRMPSARGACERNWRTAACIRQEGAWTRGVVTMSNHVTSARLHRQEGALAVRVHEGVPLIRARLEQSVAAAHL